MERYEVQGGGEEGHEKVNDGVFTDRLLHGGCNVYCIAVATSNQGSCDMDDLDMELFEMDGVVAPFQLWWYVRRIGPGGVSESEEEESDSAVDDQEDDEMDDSEGPDFEEENGGESEDLSIPEEDHNSRWNLYLEYYY